MEHFLDTPPRSNKPRSKGLTMILDKGLSSGEMEGILETGSDYIDLVKFGWGTAYITKHLEKKIETCTRFGVDVFFGGTFFEICYAQRRLEEYIRVLKDYGIHYVEISDGSIDIPREEKSQLIKEFSKDFRVLAEVGSKNEAAIISPYEWIENINADLNAGAWKIITESRESGTVGIYFSNKTVRLNLIDELCREIDLESLFFEVPQKDQQVYFVNRFGPDVNMANIVPSEIIGLETLRLGLRSDTIHLSCKGVR